MHLGLGNFFRAHQAWYTDRAPDAGEWGIAAFTGRRAELAEALTAQQGLYTLITRAADEDRFEVWPACRGRIQGPTIRVGWAGWPRRTCARSPSP